jgi:hypothetical protein
MTSSQARKDADDAQRKLARCARCGKRLGRQGGKHVAGTGACCPRCASRAEDVPAAPGSGAAQERHDMTSTTDTSVTLTGVPLPSNDGITDVLKAGCLGINSNAQRVITIAIGTIENGETAEQLFDGELAASMHEIDLSPEDALNLARHLVTHAIQGDRSERRKALIRFTESVNWAQR